MKFKIGDRVKIIKDSRDTGYRKYIKYLNTEGIITYIDGIGFYAKMSKDAITETFVPNDVELVLSTKEEIIFEVGDEVEIIKGSYKGKKGKLKFYNNWRCITVDNPEVGGHWGEEQKDFKECFKLIKKHNQPNNLTQTKTNENKQIESSSNSINLPSATTTVTRGKSFSGSSIQGRRSKLAITTGHYSNQAISC